MKIETGATKDFHLIVSAVVSLSIRQYVSNSFVIETHRFHLANEQSVTSVAYFIFTQRLSIVELSDGATGLLSALSTIQ